MFSEFQSVVLLRDIAGEERAGFENVDFKCGDIGVLVDFLGGKGGVAIEFNLGKAHTADVLFISESDIRSIDPTEVWHVRPLNPDCRDMTPAEWEKGICDRLDHNSQVVLTRAFKDVGLQIGDLGRITACNSETGTFQFQVAVGEDWRGPSLTVHPEDIRLWERDEIATIRKSSDISIISDAGLGGSPCS